MHSHAPKSATALAKPEERPLTNLERLQTQTVRDGLERRLGNRDSVAEYIATVSGQLQNPALARCRPSTLFGAIFEAAQLGLRPDPTLQHAFLVPFRNGKLSRQQGSDVYDCQLILGYRGMILLATRGSEATVTKVEADIVYASDVFEDIRGLHRDLVHRRRRTRSQAERGEPVAVYAVVHMRDADPSCEVLDWWQIEELRARSRGDGWSTWPEEMAKKTAIRRALKYIPLSPLAGRGMDLDARAEAGVDQRLEERLPPEVCIETDVIETDAQADADEPELERIPGVDDVPI